MTTRASTTGSTRRGTALVVSAPSGAGKSTLLNWMREREPSLVYSISCTTRAPRGQERGGVDYTFMSREAFLALRDAGGFAEWAEVHSNFYGTPKAPVLEALAQGRDVILDVDVQGAAQLRHSLPELVSVFILPPSREELERRLTGRGTDAPEVVAKRIRNALGEMRRANEFDFWIVNDVFETAREELLAVFTVARLRPTSRPGLLPGLFAQWPQESAQSPGSKEQQA